MRGTMIEGKRAGGAIVLALLLAAVEVWAPRAASAEETAPAGATEEAAAETAPAKTEPSDSERIDAVETQVNILAQELSKALTAQGVPEDRSQMSRFGLGPAASKVYFRDKGLSIGSYGEVLLKVNTQDRHVGGGRFQPVDDVFDALRAVLYLGYKFNDQWVINSELEFEHAGTGGGGSVSLEFLTVDYMPREWLNFRVGLVLLPMGFINELHEPVTFFGGNRPFTERQIIPTTWRENGGGILGTIAGRVHYRAYAVNGLKASGFSAAGLRGGRQKGSRAIANHWAFVGRLDVDVIDGLMAGGSVYAGKSGQDQTSCASANCINNPVIVPVPDTPTFIYELHAQYQKYGFKVRALFSQSFLQDVTALNFALGNLVNNPQTQIAERMLGTYGEIGYDIMPLIWKGTRQSLSPFFRFEYIDTQQKMAALGIANPFFRQKIYTAGLDYKPIPQIVFKVDYNHITPESNAADVANYVNFGVGYVF
jgi:hypothetical protein